MCMKREHDDYEQSGYPFPVFDFIDLTNEDFGDDGVVDETIPRNIQWDYPYNLLSSDEDEPVRGIFLVNGDESNIDLERIPEESYDDSIENTSQETTLVNDVVSDLQNMASNDTNQQNDEREFDLNVPQILLSMLTISNNLLERAMQL
ncbi:uncharacterized protein LOC126837274 [Adelges cooleyi]|uniref:uncharacterized protein LOC126837274 n=1 Tax=Adelges cooleyi TaxID=133065 RepID=UPI00218098E4|nr:uncharacterized protein LOC126837274 [Adelges cooleyi]